MSVCLSAFPFLRAGGSVCAPCSQQTLEREMPEGGPLWGRSGERDARRSSFVDGNSSFVAVLGNFFLSLLQHLGFHSRGPAETQAAGSSASPVPVTLWKVSPIECKLRGSFWSFAW